MTVQSGQNSGGRWLLLVCACTLWLSACGPTRLTIKTDIPPLLMPPLPLAIGVRMPKTFTGYVQKETGQERQWLISLGTAQADAIRRVTSAMFEHTLVLGDHAPGDAATIAEHKLNAIIEPSLDSYVYLLPSPGGADFYSATIGYKVNLESVDGTLLGSWVYEGYGSAPSRGLSDTAGVEIVTQLAIRDACANLATHLPDQELIRDLMAPAGSTPVATSTSISTPAPATAPTSASAPNMSATPAAPATPTLAPVPTEMPDGSLTAPPNSTPTAPTPGPTSAPNPAPAEAPKPGASPAPAAAVTQPATGT
jgi:hypothetical protein